MENKTKILATLIVVCLIIIAICLILHIKFTHRTVVELELTEDKLITNQTLIDLIVNKQISPLGNNLTKMILDEDDPEIMDEPWKYAYYVCNNNEHVGWIYYYAGGDLSKGGLYGPYSWCLI